MDNKLAYNTDDYDPIIDNPSNRIKPQIPVDSKPVEQPKSFATKAVEFVGSAGKGIGSNIGEILSTSKLNKVEEKFSADKIDLVANAKKSFDEGKISYEQFRDLQKKYTTAPGFQMLDVEANLPTKTEIVANSASVGLAIAPSLELPGLVARPVIRKFVSGGTINAAMTASESIGQGDSFSKTVEESAKSFVAGGLIEVGLGLTLKGAGKLYSSLRNKASGETSRLLNNAEVTLGVNPDVEMPKAQKTGGSGVVSKIRTDVQEKMNNPVANLFRYAYTRLEQDFGTPGKEIAKRFNVAHTEAKVQAGKIISLFQDSGLFKATPNSLWYKEGSLTDVLEGRVDIKDVTDPEVLKLFETADVFRKEIAMQMSKNDPYWKGIDNYFPHHIPEVSILEKSNGKVRTQILAHMESKLGIPLDEGSALIDSYVSLIKSGGKLGQNDKVIDYLIRTGQVQTREEAIGKLLNTNIDKWKKYENPASGFLEMHRDLNLPFYDPDPARVLPMYAMDAYSRLNIIEGFGKDDQVLNQLIGEVATGQGPQQAKALEGIVKIVAGQINVPYKEAEIVKGLKAAQVLKLVWSPVQNLTQNLNTMLVSDFGTWASGFKNAFSVLGKKQALESGAITEQYVKKILINRGYGSDMADKVLQKSGFTWSEQANRTIASNIGAEEASRLAKTLGLEVDEATKFSTNLAMDARNQGNIFESEQALAIRKQAMEDYNKSFPVPEKDGKKFPLQSVQSAEKRLNNLELFAGKKTESLQKIEANLDRQIKNLGKKIPDIKEAIADLEDSIASIQDEIDSYKISTEGESGPIKEFNADDAEVKAVNEQVAKELRKDLEKTLANLQEQLQLVSDESWSNLDNPGQMAEPTPGRQKLTNQENLVRLSRLRDGVRSTMVKIQNEIADKSRLLEQVIDPRPTASARRAEQMPQSLAYDQMLEAKKAELAKNPGNGSKNSNELALQDLIGEDRLNEAKLRGFLSEDDLRVAGVKMSDLTQFGIDVGNAPTWVNASPLGKVIWQFKQFTMSQSKFIKDTMIKDIERGNYQKVVKNLVLMATLFPVTNAVATEIQALMTNSKTPTSALDKYLAGFTMMSGLGIVNSALESSKSGKLSDFVLGPTFTDIGRFVKDVATGDFENLVYDLMNATGILRPVSNTIKQQNAKKKDKKRSSPYKQIKDLMSDAGNPFAINKASASGNENQGVPGTRILGTEQQPAVMDLSTGVTTSTGEPVDTSGIESVKRYKFAGVQAVEVPPEKRKGNSDPNFAEYYGEISAYSPRVEENDADPNTNAAGKKPKDGDIATGDRSIPLGTKIFIPQLNRVFTVNDRMNIRYDTKAKKTGERVFDIFIADTKQALQFGRKKLTYQILTEQ